MIIKSHRKSDGFIGKGGLGGLPPYPTARCTNAEPYLRTLMDIDKLVRSSSLCLLMDIDKPISSCLSSPSL